jgi:hypothetical protein
MGHHHHHHQITKLSHSRLMGLMGHDTSLTGHDQPCVVINADQRLFCIEQNQEACNPC